MGTVQIDGSTPKITVGNATAEDATILFDGNAQDFYIALDDSADDLLIGLGSTVGSTPAISIDENLAVKTYGDITMTGTTPVLTIGDAGAEDTAIVFDGNAQDFYIGLDDSADDLTIGVGSALGTTTALSIDEDRNVTISSGVLKIGTLTEAANDQGFNFDSTGASGISCAQGVAVAVTTNLNASGMLLMNETALSGACCLVLTGGGAVNIVAQATGSTFANTSTPTTGQFGVYLDTGKIYIKNGISGTASINMQTFRTRVQS
jgi:hypothetical protein